MILDIKEHFDKEYPREGCGIIAVVKGRKQWFPCTNVAEGDEDFVICSQEYLKINRSADIIAIVHSHPDASNEPSLSDINNCNAMGIPYHIFSYPQMDLYLLQPETIAKPLIGREYEFGVTDCFEAARDYLSENFSIEVKQREAFENDWWDKGYDYFNTEMIESYGFKEVKDAQPGDLLIFAVQNKVGNHCGIYLGNNTFFHHAEHRLSCRESMTALWLKSLIGVYRYVT